MSSCAQCGSPAEDGFSRQYCSSKACEAYRPPPVVVVDPSKVLPTAKAGRRRFGAVRNGPYLAPGAGSVELDLVYPDGSIHKFDCHNDRDVTYRAHGGRQYAGWCHNKQFGYADWEHTPMWDAVMEALQYGVGVAWDDGPDGEPYAPLMWVT